MKPFMNADFLLDTPTAQRLYRSYAADMPIYDYHCHISPDEILHNKGYDNLTQVWLYGDHYKWRIMRANGVDESLCTGPADDYERFLAYCRTLPLAAGNPLYHWSHLELQRFFGIDLIINERNAPAIWERANALLRTPSYRCRELIRRSRVQLICTTDDPADDLATHAALAREDLGFAVYPAFRPDRVVEIGAGDFAAYIGQLAQAADTPIESYTQLLSVLRARLDHFAAHGCRLSDHGLLDVPYAPAGEAQIGAVFAAALRGNTPDALQQDQYKSALLQFFAREYAARGWVMQWHVCALRDNNSRMFERLGPNTGYDSVGMGVQIGNLSRLLNSVERAGGLPKCIFYSLNQNDNYALASMAGNFADGTPGKMQLGSAWWFNDSIDGMRAQLAAVANTGLLGRFVGMLTDSRSFLSYTRHEYFRRVLCAMVGQWVDTGQYPDDDAALERIIRGVCYDNAVDYFNMTR